MIIDAGTGIRLLGLELLKGDFGKGKGVAHVLFTHTHWDHIQGFPFFMPAYVGQKDASGQRIESACNLLNLYGSSDVDDRLEATLRGQMEHFYFPVDLNYLNAAIKFHPINAKAFNVGSTKVIARRLIHPNGVLGYRFIDGNKILAVATDCEHPGDGMIDPNVIELAQDADLFIYDAQYTPQEYNPADCGLSGPGKKGWGHSTPIEGARIARTANVKRLILTHHDPLHNDDMIRSMEKLAQEQFPNSTAAYEGLIIEF
ncbi:MAG: MBL fold metallo-hydrolase [Candidatus Riflebacteria bacterium]|nr:MBL fold metallo-hydrolase [Candidatus Riflebacteria bacterium]